MSFLSMPINQLEEEVRQSSLLQVLVPSNETIPLSHFVEYFDGDVLDSIWDQVTLFNNPVFSMVDAVGEGFSIFCPAVLPTIGVITSGNQERHFDPRNSIMESIQRRVTANGTVQSGFANRTDGDLGNTPDESVIVQDASTLTFVRLASINGLNQSTVNSSIAINTDFHRTQLDLESARAKLRMDGILEATIVSDLPDVSARLYVGMKVATFVATEAEGRIRYMEAYTK